MGIIAQATIQELTDRLDPIAVIGDYVRLEKRGERYMGLCPFHTEKTPSFSVSPDQKLYYCFGCGKGGTILGFIMEMDKLSFTETVTVLAKRYGIPVVYENAGPSPPDQERFTRIEEITELYRRVAGSFHYWLTEKNEGQPALAYIISRGISMEMIKAFRLGYTPQDRRWLFRFLTGKGYSEAFLASSMLFSAKDRRISFFSNRLMFPITDRQGKTLAFGARLLSGEGPKYLNSGDSDFYKKGRTLYGLEQGLPAIRKTKEVYIAEGYMDVIALHQAGITNAVAPLGTALTDEQARLLRRWAERAYLVFDADRAGRDAAVRGILTCRRNGLSCGAVVPGKETEAFKDPADILKELGAEVLREYAKCLMLDCEYLMFHSKSLFDLSNAEGKTKAVTYLFPYLETLDSDVSRETAIEQIADAFGVDRAAVRNDFTRIHSGGKRRRESPKSLQAPKLNDELHILIVVSANQHLYPELRSKLLIKDVTDIRAKELFGALEACYINDEYGIDALLARISSEEVRNLVIEKGRSKEFLANPEKQLRDSIYKFTRRRLEKRQAEWIDAVKKDAGTTDGLDEKIQRNAELIYLLKNAEYETYEEKVRLEEFAC